MIACNQEIQTGNRIYYHLIFLKSEAIFLSCIRYLESAGMKSWGMYKLRNTSKQANKKRYGLTNANTMQTKSQKWIFHHSL